MINYFISQNERFQFKEPESLEDQIRRTAIISNNSEDTSEEERIDKSL